MLGILAGRRLFRLPLAEAVLFGLDAAYGTTVMMGLPLVLAVCGVALKLLTMPLLAWLAGRALHLEPLTTAVVVVTAGVSTGANAVVLTHGYVLDGGFSGAMVLIGTVLFVLTLTVLIVMTRSD